MIQFDHVTLFRDIRAVLDDVVLSIDSSEKVAILGGSGEGKTTILKLILRLFRPDEGRIFIDGEDIGTKTEDELRPIRKKFSIVFQEGALFDSLSVKENVAFYFREYTKMSEDDVERRVRELLRIVDMEQALYLMPEELSGGMQRRVAIARAFAAEEPKMFLYDEPTSGLDPVNAQTICTLINNLSHTQRGFIIVTHDILSALQVANRFLFIKGGVFLFDGDGESLVHSGHPEVQKFVDMLHFDYLKGILQKNRGNKP